jgi:hypothetical protein
MFPLLRDEYEVAFRQRLAEGPIPSQVIVHLSPGAFLQHEKHHQ